MDTVEIEAVFVFRLYDKQERYMRSFLDSDCCVLVDFFNKNREKVGVVVLVAGKFDTYSMNNEEFCDFLRSMTIPPAQEVKIPPLKEFVGNFLFTRNHQILKMG